MSRVPHESTGRGDAPTRTATGPSALETMNLAGAEDGLVKAYSEMLGGLLTLPGARTAWMVGFLTAAALLEGGGHSEILPAPD